MGRADEIDSREPTRSSGPSLSSRPLDEGRFPPGTVLARRYRIVSLLGRGGMGEVYRADDLRLRQSVALKMLPAGVVSDPTRLSRFHDEVRLARQVSHPNVCRVHDIGEAEGLTFLTMEHVDGEDLASLLRRVGRLPAERAAVVGRQICAGLAAAHDRGVLHRDLKPANVMIDGRGRARLTDFGLAVAAGDARERLAFAGTPAYMAPEQLEGRPVSTKTDLYALGLVLYELFTGHRPFVADSLPRLAELRQSSSPPAPTSHVPDLDPRVERAILQCLEQDPSRRPASAGVVAAALVGPDALTAAIAAGETPSPALVAAAGESTGLRPGTALALAALAVAAQLLGVGISRRTALLDQIPLEKPPEVLAERARGILSRLGRTNGPADRAYGFAGNRGFVRWVEEHDPSPRRWQRLATGQPAVIEFWYRESVRRMEPLNDRLIVTASDPPLEAGMALVRLDTQGRLLDLLVPPQSPSSVEPVDEPPRGVDLFAEAGLDAEALRPSPRRWLPPVFADTTATFEGAFPQDPTIPLRVETASRAGRPVVFRLRGPWDEPELPDAVPLGVAGVSAITALLAPVLLVGLLLARHNSRRGRSDRRGALRIAAFVFLCDVTYALLRYGHAHSALDGWFLGAHAVGMALFDAATVWILYVALEPYVRRRWPAALVSWSRILSGRFADPLVGRDVLVAALASAGSVVLFALAQSAPLWRGQPATPLLFEGYLTFLLGFPRLLAWLFGFVAVTAVITSLMLVLLFVLIKALVRGRAAAGILGLAYALACVLAVRPLPEQVPFYIALAAVVAWLVVRHGLLALVLMYLFAALLLESLATTHLGAWYGQPAVLSYLLAAGLLGWGLYASLSGHPLRWDRLLER